MTDRSSLPKDVRTRLVDVAAARAHLQIVDKVLQGWPLQAAVLMDRPAEAGVVSPAGPASLPSMRTHAPSDASLLHRTGAHLLARVWARQSGSTDRGQIRLWWTALAIAVCATIWLGFTPPGLSVSGQRALAIFAATAILWASEAFPIPLTALGVCAAFSVAGVASGPAAFQGFSSPTIFFLLGALMLGAAFEKVDLHRRIAAFAVRSVGKSPFGLVMAVFAISFLLTFAIPYHAVTAMFVPVIGSIVLGIADLRSQRNMARLLFMTLAIGSSIGSMASLIGATRNPIALELLVHETGSGFGYITWLSWTAPIVAPFAVCTIAILWWTLGGERVRGVRLSGAAGRIVAPGTPLSRPEWMVLGVVALAITGWMTIGQHLGLVVVSVAIPALLLVTRAVSWYDLEHGVSWSLILYYGGALTIGAVFQDSGLAAWLASHVQEAVGPVVTGGRLMALAVGVAVAVTMLSQVIGNSAVVVTILPVALKLSSEMQISPVATTTVVVLASSLSFCLPVAGPANMLIYERPEVRKREFLVVGSLITFVGLVILCGLVPILFRAGYWS